MTHRTLISILTLIAVTLGLSANAHGTSDPQPAEARGSLALYNGRTIDLAVSWQGAQACAITESGNVCYDTVAELDRAANSLDAAAMATCSTPLRLYANTGYGTPVLQLSTRYTQYNLSNYNFHNRTSSYKVGACATAFYDGSTIYPGATGPWAQASSMASGWNNRIKTVHMN